MFSECWLEGDGHPIEPSGRFGAELDNFVSREQKGNFVELHWRGQEEGRYGPVVASLKFAAEQELRSWSC